MNRLLADLLYEGVLDQQYLSLKELKESSPNFLSELATSYFNEAENYIRKLRQHVMMDRNFSDYNKMEVCLYGLKGCSTYIGAKRVTNVLLAFEDTSKKKNQDMFVFASIGGDRARVLLSQNQTAGTLASRATESNNRSAIRISDGYDHRFADGCYPLDGSELIIYSNGSKYDAFPINAPAAAVSKFGPNLRAY